MTIRIRRWLRILSFVAAVFVGLLFLALAATQTGWFKDWLRRYVIREADEYLNGHLAIRRIDGNLFTGIEIEGVEVTQDKVTVFAAKDVGLRYSLIDLLSTGATIDAIRIDEPTIRLERDAERLERRQPDQGAGAGGRPRGAGQAADDRGHRDHQRHRHDRRRHGSVGSLAEADRAHRSAGPVRLSAGRLQDRAGPPLAARAASRRWRSTICRASWSSTRTTSRSSGWPCAPPRARSRYAARCTRISTRRPSTSSLTSDKFTPREFAGFVPALADVRLQPAFDLKAEGALAGLATELALRSDAGGATAKPRRRSRGAGARHQGRSAGRGLRPEQGRRHAAGERDHGRRAGRSRARRPQRGRRPRPRPRRVDRGPRLSGRGARRAGDDQEEPR